MILRIFLYSLVSLSLINPIFSQEDEEDDGKPETLDHFYFDLNHDNWLGTPSNVKTEWHSRGVNVGFMYDHVLNKHVAIGLGVGFSTSNVFSNALPVVYTDTSQATPFNYTELTPLDSIFASTDSYAYTSTKLSTNYVEFPVELRFRMNKTKEGHRFKWAIGGKVSYLFETHSKTLDINGKSKGYEFPHMSDWRYGATARFGYGKIWLNGFYSLAPLFDEDSPEITLWSVGVGITL